MPTTDDRDGIEPEENVLGGPLAPCSRDPETGYLRDGLCRHLARDPGRHEVCAVVTDEFLAFSRRRGNDLVTPRPDLGFPGLSDGDRWCLCLPRWLEAREAGVAPPVVLAATNAAVLDEVSMDVLRAHAVDGEWGDATAARDGDGDGDGDADPGGRRGDGDEGEGTGD